MKLCKSLVLFLGMVKYVPCLYLERPFQPGCSWNERYALETQPLRWMGWWPQPYKLLSNPTKAEQANGGHGSVFPDCHLSTLHKRAWFLWLLHERYRTSEFPYWVSCSWWVYTLHRQEVFSVPRRDTRWQAVRSCLLALAWSSDHKSLVCQTGKAKAKRLLSIDLSAKGKHWCLNFSYSS